MLYHWRKKYPEYYDVPNQKHWRQAPTELKHDVIKHCLIKGEPVKLVAEEIGYTPSLAEKFERLRNELQIYQSRQLEILSADAIDLDIRRQTTDPKIGFDFFNVDDDTFREALESKKTRI